MTHLLSFFKKISVISSTVLLLTIFTLNFHIEELNAETQPENKNEYNGIFVGKAKRFDHRAFQLMLRKAEEDLAMFNFLNRKAIAASIGKFQGRRFQSRQLSFQATTLPLPEISTTSKSQFSSAGETGDISDVSRTTKDTQTTDSESTSSQSSTELIEAQKHTDMSKTTLDTSLERTSKRPSVAPTIPGLETLQPVKSPAGEFSLSGLDLLAQQLALNYKVVNLRLLRNLAISDRYYAEGQSIKTRAQVLLGFQVSISPQKRNKNAVAEVKITLRKNNVNAVASSNCDANDSSDVALSLMSILPAKNTYNVMALTQDAKTWGAGAIVNVFNVGISGGKKSETFYMVKDTDTFAMEFPAESTGESIAFGWQFRPVLGRKSVEPGPRNVFALISLPQSNQEEFEGTIEIETYWRRFYKKTQTVGPVIKKFKNSQKYPIRIPEIAEMKKELEPKVKNIEWQKIDNKNALVTLFGNNFFPGTTIFAGGKFYTEGNGLFISSENQLSFLIPFSVLVIPDNVKIFPSFSQSTTPLRFLSHLDQRHIDQISFNVTKIFPIDEANQMIEIEANNFIAKYDGSPEGLQNPLIKLGNRYYSPDEMIIKYESIENERIFFFSPPFIFPIKVREDWEQIKKISFAVPNKDLKTENIISIVVPFAGPKWFYQTSLKITSPLKVPFSVNKLSFIKEGDDPVLAVEGHGFESGRMEIIIGDQVIKASSDQSAKTKFTIRSSTLATLSVKKVELKDVKQIIIRYNGRVCKILPLKQPKPKSKPLKIISIEPIHEKDSKSVKITGENLQLVASVKHIDKTLTFKPSKDGKIGKIFIPGELTKEASQKGLTFITKDGKETEFILEVKKRIKNK